MGFLTARFPDDIARGAVGGPRWLTSVFYLPSGIDQRNNSGRSRAQHAYNVSHGLKRAAQYEAADAHFRKARGRLHSFRFKDWADYKLTTAQSRLVEITATTYQISKVYGGDEPTFEEVRPLTRLVGTIHVYKDAVEVDQGGAADEYTVDDDAGIVTFGTDPGAAVLTAACEFDVPCRFDFDDKQGELVGRHANGTMLLRWESITLIEDMRG